MTTNLEVAPATTERGGAATDQSGGASTEESEGRKSYRVEPGRSAPARRVWVPAGGVWVDATVVGELGTRWGSLGMDTAYPSLCGVQALDLVNPFPYAWPPGLCMMTPFVVCLPTTYNVIPDCTGEAEGLLPPLHC